MSDFVVRQMGPSDLAGVVALQPLAFPPPFRQDYHWSEDSLLGPMAVFPAGQWVVVVGDQVIGSCCNTVISEAQWAKHVGWMETVGGTELHTFDAHGSTLYGLDIAVHPEFRRRGVGRAFYTARFDLVRRLGLARYGTACRIPGFRSSQYDKPSLYAEAVVSGEVTDRTLTPLLRMGMSYIEIVADYMEDWESADCGALLEWRP